MGTVMPKGMESSEFPMRPSWKCKIWQSLEVLSVYKTFPLLWLKPDQSDLREKGFIWLMACGMQTFMVEEAE